MLTTTRGEQKYALVTDDDLSKHIGHRMEIKGKAADRGDGKVTIESTGTSGSDKTKVKTELKGDSPDMNYLGVKSVKMISKSCM
jgi:acylphosphatase